MKSTLLLFSSLLLIIFEYKNFSTYFVSGRRRKQINNAFEYDLFSSLPLFSLSSYAPQTTRNKV